MVPHGISVIPDGTGDLPLDGEPNRIVTWRRLA